MTTYAEEYTGDELTLAIKHKEAMQALQRMEGWHILSKTINAIIEAETNRILLSEIGKDWTTHQQEFAKGNVHGLKAVLKLVENFIKVSEELEESLKDEPGKDSRDPGTDTDGYEPEFDFASG